MMILMVALKGAEEDCKGYLTFGNAKIIFSVG